MSLFITGTDTGVGKTHASAALMARYAGLAKLRYWKPVQTGSDDDDRATALRLSGLGPERFLPVAHHFTEPLSPHRAAELDGARIDLDDLVQLARRHMEEGPLLVEGAGGILVPLNREKTWMDFVKKLDLPVCIVARTGLGTINHTLLTVEALRHRDIKIAGILFCGPENEENLLTIREFSALPVLGRFYFTGKPTHEQLATIDPDDILAKFLV